MVLLALGSLFHVSSTEPVHGNPLQLFSVHKNYILLLIFDVFYHAIGLRMLQGIKATPTSGATTQTINMDKTEFAHAGSIGFVLNDYPSSGANDRHSSYPGGSR
ncbi:hypothetical protein C2845_PM06G29120 [Panicum miliaceum]|uniref:Uncharacterized protein n=1 Tax=Panicum miliaceum TaxID=4540 RepID=A0A3L6RB93_PANMI|nr:hypothetical protein C2845_PM06G29120 [Panicum miliaceum]